MPILEKSCWSFPTNSTRDLWLGQQRFWYWVGVVEVHGEAIADCLYSPHSERDLHEPELQLCRVLLSQILKKMACCCFSGQCLSRCSEGREVSLLRTAPTYWRTTCKTGILEEPP